MEFTRPMKGDKPDPKYQITFPKWGSPKYDGIRCVVRDNRTYTTSMKEIPNRYTRHMLSRYNHVDGELILGDPTAEGVYNRTQSALMSEDGEPNITFYAFDYLENLDRAFKHRYAQLVAFMRDVQPSNVVLVPQIELLNPEEVTQWYDDLCEQKYEGLMLRCPNAPYKCGRSTAKQQWLLKMKPEDTSEGIIEEIFEACENTNLAYVNEAGRTKRSTDAEGMIPKGMLGGFIVRMHDGRRVRVGPGKSTHDERLLWWNNSFMVMGRGIVFAHMGYGEKDLPRQARFHGFRNLDIDG